MNTYFFQVTTWTDAEVIATRSGYPMVDNIIEIRIDLQNKTVQMTEPHPPPGVLKSRFDAHLDDGSKVECWQRFPR